MFNQQHARGDVRRVGDGEMDATVTKSLRHEDRGVISNPSQEFTMTSVLGRGGGALGDQSSVKGCIGIVHSHSIQEHSGQHSSTIQLLTT
jgi:hypothetical protein